MEQCKNSSTESPLAKELDELVIRFTYHSPKGTQQVRYGNIRCEAYEMAELIQSHCPKSREKSLALTKLEEAVMWANASIARRE